MLPKNTVPKRALPPNRIAHIFQLRALALVSLCKHQSYVGFPLIYLVHSSNAFVP